MTLPKNCATRYGFAVLCGLILLVSGQAAMAEGGMITGVRVTPDLSNLVIRFDGQIGRHSSFVMGSPYRLVLDFESAGLAKLPPRIPVQKDPIKEVRLGHSGSRARLVVDFGENPVPPFRIERGGNQVSVAFGNRLYQGAETSGRPTPSVSTKTPSVKPPPVAAPSASLKTRGCPVTIKTTGVKDHTVFVDLADSRDPQRCFRLVLDLDLVDMKVLRATLGHGEGTPEKAEISVRGADRDEPLGDSTIDKLSSSGRPAASGSGSRGKSRFKWGVPAAGGAGLGKSDQHEKAPFSIERFSLPSTEASSDRTKTDEWDVMPSSEE